jgi:hypothetical protein
MSGLAFDGGSIGPARQRFRHVARTKTMRGVTLLQTCRPRGAFDNPIDRLVRKARELDAALSDRTEDGIVALILDFGLLWVHPHIW